MYVSSINHIKLCFMQIHACCLTILRMPQYAWIFCDIFQLRTFQVFSFRYSKVSK